MLIQTKEVDATMWADVEAVLSPDGGSEGCWCMGWRRKEHLPPVQAKAALREAVEAGEIYARIAYIDGQPVGWCTFGPRETFYHARKLLEDASTLPDESSWAIPCFFIQPGFRGKGLSQRLLKDVLQSIRAHDVSYAEAYPFDHTMQDEQSKQDGNTPEDWVFTGSLSTFERQGFVPTQHCMNGCLHVMLCPLDREQSA